MVMEWLPICKRGWLRSNFVVRRPDETEYHPNQPGIRESRIKRTLGSVARSQRPHAETARRFWALSSKGTEAPRIRL